MFKKHRSLRIIACLTIIIVCGLVTLEYAFQAYATLIDRAGHRGAMNIYYQLSVEEFGYYNLFIALVTALVGLSAAYSLFGQKIKFLNPTIFTFVILMLFIVIAELYLANRWVGKG
jgi:hypothetical protein